MEREIQWLLAEKHQGKLTPAAKRDIARLKKGEHIDYVIGFVDFVDCRIDLSQKPLIPRSETEHWTLQAIQDINRREQQIYFGRATPKGKGRQGAKRPSEGETAFPLRVLDLFAGSGCIGVAVAKHVPKARVDFGEKKARFLQQIRINLRKNTIPLKRAHVLQSDVFSNIKGRYDYIFANPPYIAKSRRRKVQQSVLSQEPAEALFAGKDGLTYSTKFLKDAGSYLKHGGKIYLEFDSPQKKEIEKLLKKLEYSSWQFHKDQYGKWRFVVVKN